MRTWTAYIPLLFSLIAFLFTVAMGIYIYAEAQARMADCLVRS